MQNGTVNRRMKFQTTASPPPCFFFLLESLWKTVCPVLHFLLEHSDVCPLPIRRGQQADIPPRPGRIQTRINGCAYFGLLLKQRKRLRRSVGVLRTSSDAAASSASTPGVPSLIPQQQAHKPRRYKQKKNVPVNRETKGEATQQISKQENCLHGIHRINTCPNIGPLSPELASFFFFKGNLSPSCPPISPKKPIQTIVPVRQQVINPNDGQQKHPLARFP
jgi:hypothetical protein